MTPEQYKAAGLKRLSPAELASLERFLKGYRDETVQTVTRNRPRNAWPRRASATRKPTASVIESRIKGDFDGSEGPHAHGVGETVRSGSSPTPT